MPLDLAFIRKNPDVVIESQKRRFKPVEDVEQLLQADKEHREGK
jgi:seryl-tRNA synthetase